MLEPLYAAYRALKRARDERGPLDLDLPERKIVLTAHSTVDRVITPERLDAHRLIEEFMILANVAAAETLERGARAADLPRARRARHGARQGAARIPARRSTSRCRRAARCAPSSSTTSSQRVKGHDVEKLVNEVVLRTQAQAEYAAENYGHFGLNLRRYAHFTSPIRRYADLIVHRGADPRRQARRRRPARDRGRCARSARSRPRISATERRAMKAERETFDRLIAHFLADRIGATFEGRISGVTRAGLFVKLDDTGADGFIPARTIGNEYFRYRGGPPRHDRRPLAARPTGSATRSR